MDLSRKTTKIAACYGIIDSPQKKKPYILTIADILSIKIRKWPITPSPTFVKMHKYIGDVHAPLVRDVSDSLYLSRDEIIIIRQVVEKYKHYSVRQLQDEIKNLIVYTPLKLLDISSNYDHSELHENEDIR